MAASKRKKEIKQRAVPSGKYIAQGGNPEQYYSEYPAWAFADSDPKMWAFSQEHMGELFWTELLPKLKNLETQKWEDILVKSKKQNHSLNLDALNKPAKDRLAERFIEAESLISLRITGRHRLYGYMRGRVFHILWYDDDHGDNSTCVCRARLKHT